LSFLVFGALGLLVLSVGALIGWSVLGLVIGVVVWRCRTGAHGATVDWFDPVLLGTGAVAAVGVVVLCLVSAVMVTTMGAAEAISVLLVAVAGVAGWLFWFGPASLSDSYSAKRTSPSPALVAPPAIMAAQPAVAAVDLTVGALCLAWRRSYLELQRTTDEPTWQRVIRLRTEYLDELERQDREGFARWLGSGARAGSDPQRYLTARG
jgi:hypothetical protein